MHWHISLNSQQFRISRANDTVPSWNIRVLTFAEIILTSQKSDLVRFQEVDTIVTIISKATFCILLFGSVAVMMKPRYSLTSMMMKKPGIQHINTTQKSVPTFLLFYTYPTTFPSHTAIQIDAQHTHFFKDLNLLLSKYLSLSKTTIHTETQVFFCLSLLFFHNKLIRCTCNYNKLTTYSCSYYNGITYT